MILAAILEPVRSAAGRQCCPKQVSMAALKPVEKQVLTSVDVAGTGTTDCLENARQHSSSSASEKGRAGD